MRPRTHSRLRAQARKGRVMEWDGEAHPSRPWSVSVYGDLLAGQPNTTTDSGGYTCCLWAAFAGSSHVYSPAIVAVTYRDHYDDLIHAMVSTFGVLTISNWNAQVCLPPPSAPSSSPPTQWSRLLLRTALPMQH